MGRLLKLTYFERFLNGLNVRRAIFGSVHLTPALSQMKKTRLDMYTAGVASFVEAVQKFKVVQGTLIKTRPFGPSRRLHTFNPLGDQFN